MLYIALFPSHKITEEDFRACGEKIIADLEKYAKNEPNWIVADDNREGIRRNTR